MRDSLTHYVTMKRIIKHILSFFSRKSRPDKHEPHVVRSIVITPQTRIGLYEDVAKDFIEEIVGFDYARVFISDRSSIWDFSDLRDEGEDSVFRRIKERYGVDVSDIEDGILVRIFERIS